MNAGTPEIRYRRKKQATPPPEGEDRPLADRRTGPDDSPAQGAARRQFPVPPAGLSRKGQELARAIDEYKFNHHRPRITIDEMLEVIQSLGYHK